MATAAMNFQNRDKLPIKLFFQDEARFGRINKTSKCWTPPNQRAVIGQQIIREYTYAFSAVCPETGENFSLILPSVNTDSMNIFLRHFSEYFQKYKVIMLMDKAGWHRSKNLVAMENIVFMFLPPYSPELNPAEHLWDYIREKKKFNNNVFNSLNEVENNLSKALFDMSNDIDTIKSLCNFKWLNYTY